MPGPTFGSKIGFPGAAQTAPTLAEEQAQQKLAASQPSLLSRLLTYFSPAPAQPSEDDEAKKARLQALLKMQAQQGNNDD